MIATLLVLLVTVAVVRARWFTDLVAGAGLLVIPVALLTGEWLMALTAVGVLAAAVWAMARQERY